jgi:WD40 repeat protein
MESDSGTPKPAGRFLTCRNRRRAWWRSPLPRTAGWQWRRWADNITLWDPGSGRCHGTLVGHSAMVWSMAFTPDGTRLASASRDMTVKLWDTASGQEVLTLRGFGSEVSGVAFSPDASLLVTTDLSGAVRLWEARRSE